MPHPRDEELSDLALLERSARGDRTAFDEIVRRHQASVFRLARALVSRPADAEDVLQQTFLSAWQGAAGFRGDATARTWLMTIARHAAFRLRAGRSRERVDPMDEASLDELGLQAGWGGPDPEVLAAAAERRDLLDAAFAAVTPEDREVITLRDLEGLSGEETAALLGVSVAAMKSRLHRARLALAARVKGEVSRATERA